MLHQTPPQVPTPIAAHPVPAPPAKPPRDYTKLLVPLVVVVAVCAFVAISTQRWDTWQAGADIQTTDNA